MARNTASPTCGSATSGPASLVKMALHRIPVRFATEFNERSIPPVIMASAMAIPRIPISDNWKPMDWKFNNFGNFVGINKDITRKIPTVMRNRRIKFQS